MYSEIEIDGRELGVEYLRNEILVGSGYSEKSIEIKSVFLKHRNILNLLSEKLKHKIISHIECKRIY